jgi:feruloyl esterase
MAAKALVQAFNSKPAERSYFIGCSSGGYEGLMSPQRFPTAYDGIVAGMPANNWTRLMAGDFDATLAVFTDAASRLTPPALGVLYRGALAACDAADGVTDGVVGDPQRCRFDPSTLVCTANQAPESCLSAAQAEAARRVYQEPEGSQDRSTTLSGPRAWQ